MKAEFLYIFPYGKYKYKNNKNVYSDVVSFGSEIIRNEQMNEWTSDHLSEVMGYFSFRFGQSVNFTTKSPGLYNIELNLLEFPNSDIPLCKGTIKLLLATLGKQPPNERLQPTA